MTHPLGIELAVTVCRRGVVCPGPYRVLAKISLGERVFVACIVLSVSVCGGCV